MSSPPATTHHCEYCLLQVSVLTCHLSTGASDCCLCSSTGGVAPHPPPSHPALPSVSDVGGCQISQESLAAVCLLCKLEERAEEDQREGKHRTERDCRFKELMTCIRAQGVERGVDMTSSHVLVST